MPGNRAAAPDPELLAEGFSVPYPDDPFEVGSGPYYARRGPSGALELAVRVEPRHCNSHGVAHGGMLMTFADLAVCLAAIEGREAARAVTVSLSSSFVAPAPEGALLRVAPTVSGRTRRMAFVEAAITADGEVVFTCSAVIRVLAAR